MATETLAGGAAGYVMAHRDKEGEFGAAVLRNSTAYYARTANGSTVFPMASQTRYANADGTGAQTTTYSYTWINRC